MRAFLTCILFLATTCVHSQEFFTRADSLRAGRLVPVSLGVSGAWAGGITALSNVWYSDFNQTDFHFFNDAGEWMQMDKAGHVYTANQLTIKSYELFRWTGLNMYQSVLYGSLASFGFQSSLEVLDAYNSEWGFSWSDVAANGVGTISAAFQQLGFHDQYVLFKFSYSPSDYAQYRPQVLGSTFSERALKDYNGQTYWLSFSPKSFFPNSRVPKWLCLSFGYSVDQKLVGDQDFYTVQQGASTLNFQAQREFLFSLDIDFSQLNIRRPWLQAIVKQFNMIKIPFPAIGIRGNQFFGAPLYF